VNEIKYEKLWAKLSLGNKYNQINIKDEVKIIYDQCYEFFNAIYEKKFKFSKSFRTLENLYLGYEKASINLYKLGLCPYVTARA
jgi:hypothetical protein